MDILNLLLFALPETFLLVMASIILVADLFIPDRLRIITYALTQFTMLGCAYLSFALLVGVTQGQQGYAFNSMFVSDTMASVLKLVLYISVITCLVYSRKYLVERNLFRGEFFVLVLFAVLGMMVMISANHCIVLYLGLEMMSLCLYALVAMNRDSSVSTEAAMKYFILGALASGLLLYGMSMLYGATGTLEFRAMAMTILNGDVNTAVLVFGLVFVVAGVAFKIGAVPFHMWIPDVYHGAPNAMTLFIGTAPKLAAFAMAIRLLVNGLFPLWDDWQQMLIILSVLSLALGNLAAIAQTNIKRMFAYSTISHMGFLLLGLLAGVDDGNFNGVFDAWSASMFYAIIYVLMSLGGFGMILLLSRAGFEAENLSDFKGLNQRSPWYAFMMLLLMFSMAGVPPTVGFYAKLVVLEPLVAGNLTWLAVYAVLFSLIGAYYYLRIVKLMYFDDAEDTAPLSPGLDMRVLLSANGLLMLLLGIFPGWLMELCLYAIQTL
ncbi:MAG TPA: NADH-quinone oxidoreductase subunit NuoN [Burkholderiales bacterium]|nr:NADH-quinone oxidoreductase subunit NuoN [Burkholderiales bacterium]